VLAALESVDMVILFDEETPIDLIKALRPDVLVKGADYTIDKVVGGDVVMGTRRLRARGTGEVAAVGSTEVGTPHLIDRLCVCVCARVCLC
jgi:bifunctional ADP-heptose synthase (sugar kinase/adenylyltransferase)